tara:strand:- start:18253 stop:19221 length:969 start_codon:yes stop_codon:yes gene_type:complete
MLKFLLKLMPLKLKLFIKAIFNIETKFNNLDLERLPISYKSLKGPVYYIIFIKNKGHGFFSNFYHVLFHISIADFYNWIPIVDMENNQTLYNEKKKIFSTFNSWEYYFKQKKSLSDVDLKNDKIVFSDGNFNIKFFKEHYYGNEYYFYNIFKKHISIKNNIMKYVSSFKKKYFNNYKIIGVHWRGTDITNAKYKTNSSIFYKHRKKISIQDFANKIDPILNKNKKIKIFLSTDEKKYLKQFKNLYGDKVIHTNCYRSTSGNPIHKDSNYKRHKHRYKLGFEVLVDSLLLSESDILICRKSNVTNAAILLNYHKKRKVIELSY